MFRIKTVCFQTTEFNALFPLQVVAGVNTFITLKVDNVS